MSDNTGIEKITQELHGVLIRKGCISEKEISEWGKELEKRRAECETEGHKESKYNYVISGRSSYRDRVKGICGYCLTPLERGLTEEEHKEIDEFRKFCITVPIYQKLITI